MNKKIFAAIAFVLLFAMLLGACGGKNTDTKTGDDTANGDSGTSTFDSEKPVFDEVNAVQGEVGSKNGNVTMGPNSDKLTYVGKSCYSFETLDTFYKTGEQGSTNSVLCFDPLFYRDFGDTEEKGVMAKEWSISEDGYDVEVTIYDNIYDWEGNHITMEDFEWTWNFWRDELGKTTPRVVEGSMEFVDDYTFRFKLVYKYYIGQLQMAVGPLGNVVDSNVYDGERFRTDPVGNGRYRSIPSEFVSGAKCRFIKVYNYWGDYSRLPKTLQANVDVVGFDCISEPSQIQVAIEAGNIQIAEIGGSAYEDISANQAKTGELKLFTYPWPYPFTWVFNCAPGAIFEDNLALRQAIAYGCDMDSMCQAATRGTGRSNRMYGDPTLYGYNADLENTRYPFDLEKAAELLVEAGYPKGEGLPAIRYVFNASNDSPEAALVMQTTLATIGVKIDIQMIDEVQYLAMRVRAPQLEWDIVSHGPGGQGFLTGIYGGEMDGTRYTFGQIKGYLDQEENDIYYKALYSQDQQDIDDLFFWCTDHCEYLWTWITYDFNATHPGILSLAKNSLLHTIPAASLFADDYDVYWDGPLPTDGWK